MNSTFLEYDYSTNENFIVNTVKMNYKTKPQTGLGIWLFNHIPGIWKTSESFEENIPLEAGKSINFRIVASVDQVSFTNNLIYLAMEYSRWTWTSSSTPNSFCTNSYTRELLCLYTELWIRDSKSY